MWQTKMSSRPKIIVRFLAASVILLSCVCSAALAEERTQTPREAASALFPKGGIALIEEVKRAEGAGVPAQETLQILSRTAQASLSAEDTTRLLEPVAKVAEEGMPTGPFTDKIMEGLAKNVPSDLIVSVLDKKLAVYRTAKELVGNNSPQGPETQGALISVALAMERGVSRAAIGRLAKTAGGGDPNVMSHSAQALADLTAMGFPEAEGLRIVDAGVRAGYLKNGHTAFVEVAAKGSQEGRSPSEIADSMEWGLKRGRPLSDISMDLQTEKGRGGSPNGAGGRGGRGGQGSGSGSSHQGGGGRGGGSRGH
jgi:uncharacterized membrane protein YgcG